MHEANGDGAGLGPSILPALARQLPHLHGPNHRGVLVVVFFFFLLSPETKAALGGLSWCKNKGPTFPLFPFFARTSTNHEYTAECLQLCKGVLA